MFEAAIMKNDNKNDALSKDEQDAFLWKAGDIVEVHPQGWPWSKLEHEQFFIVTLPDDLSAEEALILKSCICIEVEDITQEKNTYRVTEVLRRARYCVLISDIEPFLPAKKNVLLKKYPEDFFNKKIGLHGHLHISRNLLKDKAADDTIKNLLQKKKDAIKAKKLKVVGDSCQNKIRGIA